jgi:hypothetical protein
MAQTNMVASASKLAFLYIFPPWDISVNRGPRGREKPWISFRAHHIQQAPAKSLIILNFSSCVLSVIGLKEGKGKESPSGSREKEK